MVVDDGGTANGGQDTDPSENTFTIDVSPTNDAPVGADATLTINEDTKYEFSAESFGFSDPNDAISNSLSEVVIGTISGHGKLMLGNTAVQAGQAIAADELDTLSFIGGKNAFGANYASLTFTLVDDGGTANGGSDTELTEHTLSFSISDVVDTFNGTRARDKLVGTAGQDVLNGKAGNDTLTGRGGSDRIYGGAGDDDIYGGAGKDVFIFKSIADSKTNAADTILDFSRSQHDEIDLSAIDANTRKAGNQDFDFIGQADFHHKAGELRFEKSSGDTYVYGDVNGDGNADFVIHLATGVAMKGGFFDL
jgi:Ca2+-binding RTX toxin-like protein